MLVSCSKEINNKAAFAEETTTEITALNAESYFFKKLVFSPQYSGYRVVYYELQHKEELLNVTLVNAYYGNRNSFNFNDTQTMYWNYNNPYFWSFILANGKNIVTEPKYIK